MVLLAFNWDLDLGFVIGLLGLVFSVWAMLRTRKLEKQQYKLNQYELEDREKAREEEKHAKLKVYGVSDDLRSRMAMRITNEGKCAAEEIQLLIMNLSTVEFPEGLEIEGKTPSRLGAGDSFDFFLNCWTDDDVLELRVKWIDEAGPWVATQNIQIKCMRD